MASLVLGVAGAGIGSAFGYASLGWSIGSMLGSSLFPQDLPTQYGPRLTDLKVQASTYGNMIPIIEGSVRMAGNMIWSTPKIETKHTDSVGGKGGPSQDVVTYTYSQSFAIAICEGPITGIKRIWANGTLIYDASPGASVNNLLSSGQLANAMRIYLGSETQLPDALIQADQGVGNTPAFRGVAYVVFDNFQLADYGNSTPNIEFEVVKAGVAGYSGTRLSIGKAPSFLTAASYISDASKIIMFSGTDYNSGLGVLNKVEVDSVIAGNSNPVLIGQYSPPINGANFPPGNSDVPAALMTRNNDAWLQYLVPSLSGYAAQSVHVLGIQESLIICWAKSGSDIYVVTQSGSDSVFYRCSGTNVAGSRTVITGLTINAIDIYNGQVYAISSTGAVNIYSTSFSLISNVLAAGSFTGGINGSYGIKVNGSASIHALVVFSDQTVSVYEVSTGTPITIVSRVTVPVTVGSGLQYQSATFAVKSNTVILANVQAPTPGVPTESFILAPTISSSSILLSTVVSDICLKAGLSAADFDVTQLTDTVDGYFISHIGSARAAIEPLMQAYYFDATESDGKIKFVKRGQASVATILEDDLAAHDPSSPMPDQLETIRQQEIELPLEVTVTYFDKNANYQIGSQRSRRLTTSSQNKQAIQMALSLSASKAKQITDVLMYDAWNSRDTFKLALPNKYSYIEPTDVFTTYKNGTAYVLRMTQKNEANGVIQCDAVQENVSVYTQSANAASLPTPSNTMTVEGPTLLQMLDIPLLRDQDDGIGFYAAACGYYSGWVGSQLFKSSDGSAYSAYGNGFLNAATIGSANGVLGNWTGGNFFDEIDSVSVTLINGTLSSATELQVLNGANYALIGSEIIQFKNATLTATNTYTLTGLLRGRQGTEWAQSTHAAGDRFVLLNAMSIYLLQASSSEYGLSRYYKPVTFGQSLNQADPYTFSNTGIAQKPYSPVQLGWGRNSAGDVVISWFRRTRISGAWADYADVPLGETSENYSIDILSGSTVLRTLTSTTNNVTYTAANQTTDLGGTGVAFTANVYQVGSYGRGYGSTISVPASTSTVALLHFNGANGSTTFSDDAGNTWTRLGTSNSISTAQSVFGGASYLVNATTGNGIYTPDAPQFRMGAFDFTIECRINGLSYASDRMIYAKRSSIIFREFVLYVASGGNLTFVGTFNGTSWGVTLTDPATLSTGTWYAVAVTRRGSTWTLWKNGVSVATATASGTLFADTGNVCIGMSDTTTINSFDGYIDEFRLTRGVALYTANYTPATTEFSYP